MSKSPHTPAPWYVHTESLEQCDGVCVEALTPDGKMVTREVCHLMIDGDTPEERAEDVANARLIAQAPVMYAMLVTLAGSITDGRITAGPVKVGQLQRLVATLHGEQRSEGGEQ